MLTILLKLQPNLLSFLTVYILVVACGKSTKGKMDGEWHIESYTLKEIKHSVSINNSTYETTETEQENILDIQGTIVNSSINYSPGSNNTTNGVVQKAIWKIHKNGTWERELLLFYPNSFMNDNIITKASGSWNFEGKIGNAKKNENVIFYLLSEYESSFGTLQDGSIGATGFQNETTYAKGENTEIYKIVESTKKTLEMERNDMQTTHFQASITHGTKTNHTISSIKLILD